MRDLRLQGRIRCFDWFDWLLCMGRSMGMSMSMSGREEGGG